MKVERANLKIFKFLGEGRGQVTASRWLFWLLHVTVVTGGRARVTV